jgi:hypothetical protein
MKSFKSYNLSEKRSHPDLNVKYDSIDIIKFYYGTGNADNMFVSFTDVNKIGINPKSRYSTPNGIYSYPLKSIIDYYKVHKSMAKLPYAGDSRFMNIFQIRSKKGIQLISEYSESDWKRDYNKLLKHDKVREDENSRDIYKALKVSYKNKNIRYGDKIDIKKIDIVKFFNFFYKDMKGVSTSDFESKTAKKSLKVLIDYYNIETSVVEKCIKRSKKIASNYLQYNNHKSIGKLWTATRKLSETNDYVEGSFPGSRWNTILRKILGYNGFIDDKAWGIIYQAEPLQAVMFDKPVIQIIQTVPNKFHNTKEKKLFGMLDDMKRNGMVRNIVLPKGSFDHQYLLDSLENIKNLNMKIDTIKIEFGGNIIFKHGIIKSGTFVGGVYSFEDLDIENGKYVAGRFTR